MTVIALSIEPGALAERFASELAASMAVELADRRRFECKLAERSDASGGQLPQLVSKWVSFTKQCSMTQRLLQQMVEETFEVAERGNVIILGWVAPIILRHVRAIPRVLILAPMAMREQNIMRQLAYDDVRMAQWEIESKDGLLRRFVQRMFDADWRDPELYDLTLNVEHLPPSACAEMVMHLAEGARSREPVETRTDLASRLQGARRQNAIVPSNASSGAVMIGSQRISLAGTGSSEEAIARVERFLRGASGENGIVLPKPAWKNEQ